MLLQRTDSGPLGNWCPGFEVADAFFLLIAAGAKSGFEFLDGTIRVPFNAEVPSGPKDFHVWCAGDEFSAFEDVGKGVIFFHGMIEIVLKWAFHSIVVGEYVFLWFLLTRKE